MLRIKKEIKIKMEQDFILTFSFTCSKMKLSFILSCRGDIMSQRSSNYTTKQSEAVLTYLKTQKGNHVTAGQVVKHFEEIGVSIGRTTIYRQLEKLVQEGKVKKYVIDSVSGACFQYSDECENQDEYIHLKCENCGVVIHLNGENLPDVAQNIRNKYDFEINVNKTVFYGKCKNCRQ